jgi:hypothetical protein
MLWNTGEQQDITVGSDASIACANGDVGGDVLLLHGCDRAQNMSPAEVMTWALFGW